MTLFGNLRMMAMLRRIARALESLARSQSVLSKLASDRDQRSLDRMTRRRAPRPTELGVMDTKEIERRYQEQLKRDSLELDR